MPLERYFYELGDLTVSVDGRVTDEGEDITVDKSEDIEGFKVFDRRAGHTDDAWVGFSRDHDIAQRIVNLLNADEDARAARQRIEEIVATDAEQQHLKKIIEARESLGSEIVEIVPGMTHYKKGGSA